MVKESETTPQASGGSFVNSNVEKTLSDIEMGDRKVAGSNGSGRADQYDQPGYNRRSSWGRRSGSWELPADIGSGRGDSNRITGGSSDSLGGSRGGQLIGQSRQ